MYAIRSYYGERGGVATLLLAPVAKGQDGPIEVDETGRIVRFLDARAPGTGPGRRCDFAGVHLLGSEVLAAARGVGRESFCINADVHAPLVAAGRPLYGFLLPEGAWWSDLGTPERYLAAHRHFLEAGRLPPASAGAPSVPDDGP